MGIPVGKLAAYGQDSFGNWFTSLTFRACRGAQRHSSLLRPRHLDAVGLSAKPINANTSRLALIRVVDSTESRRQTLADVSNGALREFNTMTAAGLSDQTIVSYAKVVKMVVASAVGDDGEQIYPRKWNHDFIGLPIVRKENQHRPTVTGLELEEILANTKRRYAVLFALLGGSGLRIGEALALKTTDLSPDCRVLHVRRSIWRNQEQQPKTPNAIREIDLAGPLPRLLREHASGRRGYVFATSNGTAFGQRNVVRALHSTGKRIGFHAFRRFRTEMLRRSRVPEDLVKLWLGHSKMAVTDFYADGLKNDLAWRQEWCERAGLGFSLNGLLGLQSVVNIDSVKVA